LPPAPATAVPHQQQRILCIDPAAAGLRVLMVFFAHAGCTVEGISDFGEALHLVASEPAGFDFVVVGCADVAGDGARITAQLRAAGHRGEIALRVSGLASRDLNLTPSFGRAPGPPAELRAGSAPLFSTCSS
jgi:hypothetical protein